MNMKKKKFGLPMLAWVIIGIAIVAGLVIISPIISQTFLGSVKSPEQAQEAIQGISTDIEDLGDILEDIDENLG